MTTVVFLDSAEEAKHWLAAHGAPDEFTRLYATHPSAKDYLDNKEAASTEISELVSGAEYRAIWDRAGAEVPALLAEMDRMHSPWLGGLLGLPGMNFISVMYSYTARCEYVSIETAKLVLEKIFSGLDEHEIRLYTGGKRSFFAGSDILMELLEGGHHDDGCRVWVESIDKPGSEGNESVAAAVESPLRNLKSLAGKVIRKVKEEKGAHAAPPSGDGSLIVAMQPLYDLAFITADKEFAGYPVMLWPPAGTPQGVECPPEIKEKIAAVPDMLDEVFGGKYEAPGADDPDMLEASVTRDFAACAVDALETLMAFVALDERRGVAAAAWGNSGGVGARKLICEYSAGQSIPVIGMRHGGCTEMQDMSDLIFSRELDHCTQFITYGATKEDLSRFLPEGCEIEKDVHPAGSTKKFEMASRASCEKEIDVLFGITQVRGVLARSYAMKSHRFYERQKEILQYLDGRENLRTIVKPQSTAPDLCAVPDTLAGLKRVEVVSGINLRDFLKKYHVHAVVLDVPSTPLYEIINMDVEIFLMMDAQLLMIPEAMEMLEKRAHCFEDPGELTAALGKWESGELPSLRDQSFARRYVYKEDAQKVIRDLFESEISKKKNR